MPIIGPGPVHHCRIRCLDSGDSYFDLECWLPTKNHWFGDFVERCPSRVVHAYLLLPEAETFYYCNGSSRGLCIPMRGGPGGLSGNPFKLAWLHVVRLWYPNCFAYRVAFPSLARCWDPGPSVC
mmetsp:Transcript_44866/g.45471  ORF Transcript_44866/g.45471 Transcript_44866/m.45471 type:complete len:124 (+) Transcript_44866:545-916(+)